MAEKWDGTRKVNSADERILTCRDDKTLSLKSGVPFKEPQRDLWEERIQTHRCNSTVGFDMQW